MPKSITDPFSFVYFKTSTQCIQKYLSHEMKPFFQVVVEGNLYMSRKEIFRAKRLMNFHLRQGRKVLSTRHAAAKFAVVFAHKKRRSPWFVDLSSHNYYCSCSSKANLFFVHYQTKINVHLKTSQCHYFKSQSFSMSRSMLK